jgi:nucleotide-binding universal stress UspA family protein
MATPSPPHSPSELATVVVGVALHEHDAPPLQLARELARLTEARLVLVHAYQYEPLIAVTPPRWAQELREQALAALEALAAPLRETVDVSVQARPSPSPVRALHEVAEELGASLLVAGGSHRTVLERVAGGVGERLLHAAPCAVAIAPVDRSVDPGSLRRIGVAFIDGPEGADALAIATGLARRAGGRVRTFTVLEGPPSGDEGHAGAIVAKVRATVPADVLDATEVLEGRPVDELTRVTAELDLLICGSRGYGPVRSLLLGGVSWTLAHTAACPLLVVPRGPVPGFRMLTGDPAPPGV